MIIVLILATNNSSNFYYNNSNSNINRYINKINTTTTAKDINILRSLSKFLIQKKNISGIWQKNAMNL